MEVSEVSRAMKQVGRHRFLVSLMAVPMGIAVARMVAQAVMLAIAGDVKNTCVTAAVLTAMVIVWRVVTALAQAALTEEKSRVLQEYRMSLYGQLLQLPLARLHENNRGRSMEELTDDLDEAAKRDMDLKPELFVSIITVVSYGFLIAYYSPVTAAILLLFSLLQLLPPMIVKRYMQVNYDDCREIEAKLDSFFLEAYHGFSTMKLYDLTEWMIHRLKGLHTSYTRIGNRSIITGHAESSMETLLENVLQYGTYGLIGYLVLIGLTTMEAGIEAIALSSSFYAAVLSAFRTIPEFGTVKVAQKRLAAWLTPDLGQSQDVGVNREPEDSLLVFDAVSYQYSEQSVTLKDVSMSIETGVTLIRGANGCGKSTLLKLVAGLLPVQSGTLRVRGVKPDQLSPQNFPKDIFFLPQEDFEIAVSPVQLYEMVEGLSRSEAVWCALSFGLTREILEDKKIDQLSAGQRKKVYLAMAFTLDSPVLMLDEPGNGLDAQGEERLLSLLCDRKKTKIGDKPLITVVVTHNPALDKAADRVIELERTDTVRQEAGA